MSPAQPTGFYSLFMRKPDAPALDVNTHVCGVGRVNLQVSRVIVALIAVYVMHYFTRQEGAAELLRCDDPMHRTSPGLLVIGRLRRLKGTAARNRAKDTSALGLFTWCGLEFAFAVSTDATLAPSPRDRVARLRAPLTFAGRAARFANVHACAVAWFSPACLRPGVDTGQLDMFGGRP